MCNPISTIQKPQIQSFLNICAATSKNILEPEYQIVEDNKCQFIGTVPILRYNINRHAFHIDQSGKMNRYVRLAIGVIGAIFGGYAYFKIKQEMKQLDLADKELQSSQLFSKYIREQKESCPNSEISQHNTYKQLQVITNAHQEIFARIRRKSNISVALLVTIVASAAVALISSFFSAWAVVTGGLSCLAIASFSLLCKWTFDGADKGHKEDAKIISATIRELQH